MSVQPIKEPWLNVYTYIIVETFSKNVSWTEKVWNDWELLTAPKTVEIDDE